MLNSIFPKFKMLYGALVDVSPYLTEHTHKTDILCVSRLLTN